MSTVEYIACVAKTVFLIALVADGYASFAVALFVFWAYAYLPKLIRDNRSLCRDCDRPSPSDHF
jgi:hypothetical protein